MNGGATNESEQELFRSVLDTLSANVAILDPDGAIVATNHAWRTFAEVNGVQNPADVGGADYLEIAAEIDSAFANRVATGLSAVLCGERDEFKIEHSYCSSDGTRWFLLRVTPFEHRGDRYITIIQNDITERRRRETALSEAYEISTASELSLTEQIDALLEITRNVLGTEHAALSRTDNGKCVFEAVTAATSPVIEAGKTLPLDAVPHCKRVIETGETLVFEGKKGDTTEFSDATLGIESFLGGPVVVDDETVGTFCFYSTDPRAEPFSEWAVTFVGLLSSWVSYELDRREREEILQHIKERITDVIWLSSPDKDEIEFVSDSYEEVWGRPASTLGQNPTSFAEAVHPDDRDRVQRALAEQQTHPDEYEEQYRVIHPDGDVRWVHDQSAGVYDEGELQRIVGIATDITDRKEREEKLAYQKALLEAQAETTIDGLVVIDSDSIIRYHNSRVLDLFEIPEDAVAEQSSKATFGLICDQLANPDAFLEEIIYLNRHPKEQSRDTIELTDGRWLDCYSAPVIGDNGTHYGRLWAFRDITDQKVREQTLEQQRDELVQLKRVNTIVRRTIQALQDTTTREEIEVAVCEALTDSEIYQTAWIGNLTETSSGTVTVLPRTAVGVNENYLDGISDSEGNLAQAALDDGSTQVINDISTAPGFPDDRREIALDHEHHALAIVPLRKNEATYGVLVVYAPPDHTISETEQEVLTDLGRSIALAIQRVHSQRSLTAERVISLTLKIPDADFVFGTVSSQLDGEFQLDRRVVGQDGQRVYYLTVSDDDPDYVCDLLEGDSLIRSSSVVRDSDSAQSALIEAQLKTDSQLPLDILTDYGASMRSAQTVDGDIKLRIELPSSVEVRTVLDALREVAPSIKVVSTQHLERPAKTVAAMQDRVTERLTDKQEAALKAAYARGYYAWPRESTVEEIADTLDISGPSLHYRLRRAHETVIGDVMDSKANSTK